MTRIALLALISAICLAPAWASQPGHPLDCDDWVFLEPGISCSVAIPDCQAPGIHCYGHYLYGGGDDVVADGRGNLFLFTITNLDLPCNNPFRLSLIRFDGNTETIVAYVDARCAPGNNNLARAPCSNHPVLLRPGWAGLLSDQRLGDRVRRISGTPC